MSLCKKFLLILSVIYAAEANSGGAPSTACSGLTPGHGGSSQSAAIPYSIDLSPFADGNGGYQYTPDTTYTITLSATSGTTFRGFLVQCRLMADDTTRVGVFGATAANSRLSSCTPNTDGVTHVNQGTPRIEFTSMTMEWTSPQEGTGDVRFAFAVVQVFNTYWANQRTPVVSEAQAPQPSVTTQIPMPEGTETPVPMATETPVPVATEAPVPMATETPVPVATEAPVPMATESPMPNSPSDTPTVSPGATTPASANGLMVSMLSLLLALLLTTLIQ